MESLVRAAPRNPGEVLGCLGLLALAERSGIRATGHFGGEIFHLRAEADLLPVLHGLQAAAIRPWRINVEKGSPLDPVVLAWPDGEILLDWWYSWTRKKKTPLKMWAGNQSSFGMIQHLLYAVAMSQPPASLEGIFTQKFYSITSHEAVLAKKNSRENVAKQQARRAAALAAREQKIAENAERIKAGKKPLKVPDLPLEVQPVLPTFDGAHVIVERAAFFSESQVSSMTGDLQRRGHLGLDARLSWDASSLGYSLNDTDERLVTYPWVELLAAIGAQTLNEIPRECANSGHIDYTVWTSSLPLTLARLAYLGEQWLGQGETIRYRSLKRLNARYGSLRWAHRITAATDSLTAPEDTDEEDAEIAD